MIGIVQRMSKQLGQDFRERRLLLLTQRSERGRQHLLHDLLALRKHHFPSLRKAMGIGASGAGLALDETQAQQPCGQRAKCLIGIEGQFRQPVGRAAGVAINFAQGVPLDQAHA